MRSFQNFLNLATVPILLLLFTFPLTAQPLSQLLAETRANNPALAALNYEYQAALEIAPQVSQLPDPNVELSTFLLPVETRLGPQRLRAGATQTFPWFGTLAQREQLAQQQAAALYPREQALALQLALQLKQAYYQLYGIRESQAIIITKLDLLASLERLALRQIESGKGSPADVLRLQIKTEGLEQQLQILQRQEQPPLATINQIRHQALNTPVQITEALALAQLPFQRDSLLQYIRSQHPQLRHYTEQQQSARQAIALNKLEAKPSFGLGLDYFLIDERENATINNNGQDALQLRASIRVPLHHEQYRAKAREENFRIAALEQQKEDQLQRFLLQIETAYAQHETASLQATLYQRQLELTAAASELLRASYSTQATRFNELLTLEMEQIDYQLKLLQATVASHLARSTIEQFLPY